MSHADDARRCPRDVYSSLRLTRGDVMWAATPTRPCVEQQQVLLGKMGGPFWKSKPRAWSIFKGMPERGESAFQCALREFYEETHSRPPTAPTAYRALPAAQQKSKLVVAWAVEAENDKMAKGGSLDPNKMYSNMVDGQNFPEMVCRPTDPPPSGPLPRVPSLTPSYPRPPRAPSSCPKAAGSPDL